MYFSFVSVGNVFFLPLQRPTHTGYPTGLGNSDLKRRSLGPEFQDTVELAV